MQLLCKATYKKAKLVIIGITVPKLSGLFNTAATLVCNINQSLQDLGEKDHECGSYLILKGVSLNN